MSKDAEGASLVDQLRDFITQRRERRMVMVLRWLKSWISKPRALPKSAFEPLSPVDVTDDKLMVYESELLNALRTPEVRNIAITGGYGAGKSSLIKSFVKRHPEYRYAFVSLAAFEGDGYAAESRTEDEKALGEEAIESAIVQQLLYSVPSSNVPGTRLRRISYASKIKVGLAATIAFVTAVSYLRLIPAWPEFLPNLSGAIGWIPSIVAQMAFSFGVLAGIYWIVRILSSLRLQEVSIKGMKWDGGATGSVLHKHVDEIIHLFEMVPIDVVVVEDLDRFNDRSPFVRLREINFILNSSAGIHHPVRFVYALNDQLFGSDDKAKFFDIAIPVVPIINSDNTRDMFMSLLERRVPGVSNDELVSNLLETVAYHVGDLRQIKQMVNEFELYRAVLKGGHTGEIGKELAMVVIRCVYPQEYASLLKGTGSIQHALHMFPAWLRAELEACLNEEKLLVGIETQKEQDVLNGVSEIMALIWSRVEDKSRGGSISHVVFDGFGRFNKKDFASASEKIDQLLAVDTFAMYRGASLVGEAKLSDVLISGEPSMRERLALLSRSDEQGVAERTRVSSRIEELRAMTISDALSDPQFNMKVSGYCTENGLQLIPYMMKVGVLAADYSDYIGYFYAGSISQGDKSALLNLRTGMLLDVDHQLDSPSLVLKKLSIKELEGGVGMLSCLICETLDGCAGEPSLRARRLEAILSASGSHFERIDTVFGSMHNRGRLRDLIRAGGRGVLTTSLELAERGRLCSKPELKLAIATCIAAHFPPSDAGEFRDPLASLLSGLSDIDELLADEDAEFLDAWFAVPSARISRVSSSADAAIISRALRVGMLQVNPHNVKAVARGMLGVEIDTAKYSELLNLESPEILEFVESEWAGYLNQTYVEKSDVKESESVLAQMIGVTSDPALQELVMQKVDCLVRDLELIPHGLWGFAFDYMDVVASTDNLMRVAMLPPDDDGLRLRMAGELLSNFDVADEPSPEFATEDAIESLCRVLASLSTSHPMKAARLIVRLRLFDVFLEIEDPSQSFFAALISAGLPLTQTTFLAAEITADDTAIELAVNQFDAFLDYAAHWKVGGFITHGVMVSRQVTTSQRRALFSRLHAEVVGSSSELARICFELLLNVETAKELQPMYDRARVAEVFRCLESEDAVIELLSTVLLVAPWVDVLPQFSRLQTSGFRSLLEFPRRIEVQRTSRNLRLLGMLRERGIVGAPNEKGESISVRVRPSKLRA